MAVLEPHGLHTRRTPGPHRPAPSVQIEIPGRPLSEQEIVIKAILWDNDGVLVDTEHLYFEATRRVLESVGIPLTEEQYLDLFLIQNKGAWHLVEAQGVAPDEVLRLRDERNSLYSRLL